MVNQHNSIYHHPAKEKLVATIVGVVTGTDRILSPDVTVFLALNQHPVRVLFREVKNEVRLDTLDKLIEGIKRLTDLVYRTNTARLSGKTTVYVAQKIVEIDDAIAMINQIYGLFRYQFDQR